MSKFLTVSEVAERLNVSVATVYNLVEQSRLAHHRIGVGRGAVRVSEEQLRAYLESTQRGGGLPPKEGPPAKTVTLNHLSLG